MDALTPIWVSRSEKSSSKGDSLQFDETQMHDTGQLMKFAAMALGTAAPIMQLFDDGDGSRRPVTDLLDAEFLPALKAISR